MDDPTHKTLAAHQRDFDFAGRWGGDEFISLLAHVNRKAAASIANRLRILVAGSDIEFGDEKLHPTISVGGTFIRPEDTIESLVQRADENMYLSKRGGKNRTTIDGNLPAKPQPAET